MTALEHAVEPPTAELIAAVVALGGDAADVDQSFQHLGGVGPSLAQKVERALRAEALGLEQVLATGAEGRTAIKVSRPLASPGVGGRRLPGLPRLGGVDLVQRRELRFHCYTSVIICGDLSN